MNELAKIDFTQLPGLGMSANGVGVTITATKQTDSNGVVHGNDLVNVGYIRAASYGFTVGGAVGLMMVEGGDQVVDAAFLDSGTWEVEIAGKLYPCVASLKPLYDPENKRIKM